MSTLNDTLDAVVADHQAAALTIGGSALTVVKRKLPKKEETVDAPYQVTISAAADPDEVTPIGGYPGARVYLVKYRVEMTLITPNDHDAVTNLADHEAWREATRARYQKTKPLAAVAAVKRVEIKPAPFLDRSKLADGYDYNQIVVSVWTYETRS